MTPVLFLAQRVTAAILALAVFVHLGTILYATQSNLTAGDILARTRGNIPFFIFYLTFVVAAAIHAPIGLRNILEEWAGCRGPVLNAAMAVLAALTGILGCRAAWAVFQ